MANKDGGRILKNFKITERKLLAKIDQREKTKDNFDNVGDVLNSPTKITKNGERVWSF